MISSQGGQPQQSMYSGRWTPEEEAYAKALMKEFRDGTLPIAEGTSLRAYLAKELQCGPKRISKKYEGSGYNGKQPYASRMDLPSSQELAARQSTLQTMRQEFLVSRKRVTAGLIGFMGRPAEQTTASGRIGDHQGLTQVLAPPASVLEGIGFDAPMGPLNPTPFTRDQLLGNNRTNFANQWLDGNFGISDAELLLARASRLGLMHSFRSDNNTHNSSQPGIFARMGNQFINNSSRYDILGVAPTAASSSAFLFAGLSDGTVHNESVLEQRLMENIAQQNLLRQRMSFLAPRRTSLSAIPTLSSQSISSDSQRILMIQHLERNMRELSSVEGTRGTTAVLNQSAGEETKGQEEAQSSRFGVSEIDDSPAPKRPRNF